MLPANSLLVLRSSSFVFFLGSYWTSNIATLAQTISLSTWGLYFLFEFSELWDYMDVEISEKFPALGIFIWFRHGNYYIDSKEEEKSRELGKNIEIWISLSLSSADTAALRMQSARLNFGKNWMNNIIFYSLIIRKKYKGSIKKQRKQQQHKKARRKCIIKSE